MIAEQLIINALREKGYRTLTEVLGWRHDPIARFTVYSDGVHVLILQVYKRGGCELYAPIVESNDIQATIDAIPVRYAQKD